MFFQRRGQHLFTLWGVDVSASLWYGVLMAFIAVLWPLMGTISIPEGILLAVVVTASLLAHEFGHAAVAKHYDLRPSILLHAFGGFCDTDREAGSDGDEAKVVFAGPVVGLVVGGAAALVMVFAPGVTAMSPVLQTVIPALVWFNVGWSLFNLLLPIWPYDGGRLFHLLLRRVRSEKTAREWTLNASIVAAIGGGIVGVLYFGRLLAGFLAFYVVMDNYRRLKSGRSLIGRESDRSKHQASSFHEELLEEAREAMERRDWAEAARLGHQMRSVGSMPESMLEEVWTILGVATMEQGDCEQALSYLERAPETSEIEEAIQQCNRRLETEDADE